MHVVCEVGLKRILDEKFNHKKKFTYIYMESEIQLKPCILIPDEIDDMNLQVMLMGIWIMKALQPISMWILIDSV